MVDYRTYKASKTPSSPLLMYVLVRTYSVYVNKSSSSYLSSSASQPWCRVGYRPEYLLHSTYIHRYKIYLSIYT